jgi:hypothetical protein
MRWATYVVIAVTGAALPGAARAEVAACEVTIVEAPRDVRDAVIAWVQDEWSCKHLELRAVAIEGAYALFALRSDGRVFARTVPDSPTAGALVASWAAADAEPAPGPALELMWMPRSTHRATAVDADLDATPPRSTSRPKIDVTLRWAPPAAPKPAFAVELGWTPPGSTPEIEVDLAWTPGSPRPALAPAIDVQLEWIPPRARIDLAPVPR